MGAGPYTYIGGIFNNFQPCGGSIVVVTVDLNNDHLGWDVVASADDVGTAPAASVQRSALQRRARHAIPMAKLAKLRNWKQRSRSNRNK